MRLEEAIIEQAVDEYFTKEDVVSLVDECNREHDTDIDAQEICEKVALVTDLSYFEKNDKELAEMFEELNVKAELTKWNLITLKKLVIELFTNKLKKGTIKFSCEWKQEVLIMVYESFYEKRGYLIKEIKKTKLKLGTYKEEEYLTKSARQRILKLSKHLHNLTDDLDWTCHVIERKEALEGDK